MTISTKGSAFIERRIGQDALTIAALLEQGEAKDAYIAQLEVLLTPRQREKLKVKTRE